MLSLQRLRFWLTRTAYNFPNDESEQDRLDLNHHLCLMLLDDKLHLTELSTEKPLRILDVGTGTGIWAMDMGDTFPNAEVVSSRPPQARRRIRFLIWLAVWK